ncbi:MAG: RDD family protein [Fimbriimonadales bacterium]|nr:RDD family protein [Fimbriimonadales bacterium]
MEWWIILITVIVLADLALVGWIIAKAKKGEAKRKQSYEEWLSELQQDPLRWRLYEAHWTWKARIRTSLAVLIDMGLSIILAIWVGGMVGNLVGLTYQDGLSDSEVVILVVIWIGCALVVVFGSLCLWGATPGMHLMGISVVSSRTGRAPARGSLHYPTKWDYRRDRVLEYFFVPKEEIRQ